MYNYFGRLGDREIGQIIDKSEAACRQLLRRAKGHLADNQPRFTPSPEQHEKLLHRFIAITENGEVEPFLQLLAEDVSLVPDGGGEYGAATRIMHGRDAVAAFIFGVQRLAPPDLNYEVTSLNGEAAILARRVEGPPFFALFIHGQSQAHSLHVIAGQKLRGLTISV